MTSLPPKYESAAEEEEGLLSETTYPPGPETSTSRALAPTNQDDISTTLCFRPSYPMRLTAENANAMAPLPRSRVEAVRLAVEAFPLLQDFPEDRIRFFVGQAAILTSAWGSLRRDPPPYITVLVSDGPGDLQKRQRHQRNANIRCTAIFLAIVGPMVAVLLWVFIHF